MTKAFYGFVVAISNAIEKQMNDLIHIVVFFKYVIQNEDDLAEVQSMVRKYDLADERIILMPEAKDRETLLERSVWLVEHCKCHGYLCSTRLQVLLWGNRRGV